MFQESCINSKMPKKLTCVNVPIVSTEQRLIPTDCDCMRIDAYTPTNVKQMYVWMNIIQYLYYANPYLYYKCESYVHLHSPTLLTIQIKLAPINSVAISSVVAASTHLVSKEENFAEG